MKAKKHLLDKAVEHLGAYCKVQENNREVAAQEGRKKDIKHHEAYIQSLTKALGVLVTAKKPRSPRYGRFKGRNKTWTWTVYARNGKVVCSNSGFNSARIAKKAMVREYPDVIVKK